MTPEILDKIKTLAGLLFSPKEIAIMLGIEDSAFILRCKQEGCEEYIAYQGGRLEEEMMIRKSILTLAHNGSSPAQTLAMKLIDESRLKEIER